MGLGWNQRIWQYLYYNSPQSVLDTTDPNNTSTYTSAQYLARPAQVWSSHQHNMVQGPTYGSNTGNGQPGYLFPNNNYGSDYFQDAFGYMTGGWDGAAWDEALWDDTTTNYAPAVAFSEPTTYGAGQWTSVNGKMQYVAQPLASTSWPTRESE